MIILSCLRGSPFDTVLVSFSHSEYSFSKDDSVRTQLNLFLVTTVHFFCYSWGGGDREHRGSICASHPAAPGLILGVPKNLSLDVAEIY